MKKKDRLVFHSSSIDDLKKKLDEMEKKNTHIQFSRSTTNAKNSREARLIRHTTAVIQSIIREHELGYGEKK